MKEDEVSYRYYTFTPSESGTYDIQSANAEKSTSIGSVYAYSDSGRSITTTGRPEDEITHNLYYLEKDEAVKLSPELFMTP